MNKLDGKMFDEYDEQLFEVSSHQKGLIKWHFGDGFTRTARATADYLGNETKLLANEIVIK